MSSCDVEDAGWLAWCPRSAYQWQLPSAKASLGKLLVCFMIAYMLHNSSILIYLGVCPFQS